MSQPPLGRTAKGKSVNRSRKAKTSQLKVPYGNTQLGNEHFHRV